MTDQGPALLLAKSSASDNPLRAGPGQPNSLQPKGRQQYATAHCNEWREH